MLNFIKTIAFEAGEIIRKGYLSPAGKIVHKGDIDLVTETDLKSEELLIRRISRRFPADNIIAEESGADSVTGERNWIIDPLDGTTNFSHRFPVFAVSIGLEIEREMIFGVVYNPVSEEIFSAEKGMGAFLNEQRIQVSKQQNISKSLVASGFPYDRWQKGDEYIKDFLTFMKRTQGVRRVGAAALDLCSVACGRLDGFFERKLKPWDMAAGSIILLEAGGKITQFSGAEWHYANNTILASNTLIHPAMTEIINSCE